jgi:hypothetical protein
LNKAPGDAWLEAARVMRGFCSASAAPHKAGGGKQRGRGMSGEEQEAANQTRQGLQSKRTMAACNGSPSPRCTCPVDCCITAAASLLFSSAAQAGTPRVDDDISAAAASAQQGALQPEETGRSSDVPRATGGAEVDHQASTRLKGCHSPAWLRCLLRGVGGELPARPPAMVGNRAGAPDTLAAPVPPSRRRQVGPKASTGQPLDVPTEVPKPGFPDSDK